MIRNSFRRCCKPEKLEYARKMRKNPTKAEAILWDRLKGKKLGVKFRRQAIIYGWIVDFYSPFAGIVIEVDGECHIGREEEDEIRTRKIETIGVNVVRFKNDAVIYNTEKVVEEILNLIKEHVLK